MRLLSHGEKPRSQGHLRNPSRLTTFCLLALISCSHLLVSNVVVHIKACESQPHEQQISSRRSFARAVALPLATSASFHSNFWRCVLVGLLLCCHTSGYRLLPTMEFLWHGTRISSCQSLLSPQPSSKIWKSASEPSDIGARRRSHCLKIAPGEAQRYCGDDIQPHVGTAVRQLILVGADQLGSLKLRMLLSSFLTAVCRISLNGVV